jgi:hypothetical protein
MKTTLDLDDTILAQAKQRAAASGTTLKAFVEDALREKISAIPKRRKHHSHSYRMNVVHGTKPPAIDIYNRSTLYDYLDGLD